MQTILLSSKKDKANSFTLVELLVVISIIGILAGLAIPAIQAGLDKAKQQVDVSNARQCGLILFADANDNEGVYSTNSNSSLQMFQDLIAKGLLNNAKVLGGNGFRTATSIQNVTQENIAWAYVTGLLTSDEGTIPLLVSKGVTDISLNQVDLKSIKTGWKQKGIVVYRVGNTAEFLRSGSGGAPIGRASLGLDGLTVTNKVVQ